MELILLGLVVAAIIAFLLLRGASGSQPAAELRNAMTAFERAETDEDKRAAAERIRRVIADNGLTGSSLANQALQLIVGY